MGNLNFYLFIVMVIFDFTQLNFDPLVRCNLPSSLTHPTLTQKTQLPPVLTPVHHDVSAEKNTTFTNASIFAFVNKDAVGARNSKCIFDFSQ